MVERMKLYHFAGQILARLNHRSREVYLCGLVIGIAWGLVSSAGLVGDGKEMGAHEMTIHGDWQNLYEAAERATWADAPRWWAGPWNYPKVGYYRPLTSMLYLAEQKSFGLDFSIYNRITWLMHGACAGLLYTLAFLLLRGHPLKRAAAGLIAVRYFATVELLLLLCRTVQLVLVARSK